MEFQKESRWIAKAKRIAEGQILERLFNDN